MNCEQSQECMMDILYGEETDSRRCFDFFGHLGACSECSSEYIELIETREMLRQWDLEEEAEPVAPAVRSRSSFLLFLRKMRLIPVLGKVAAGFLILMGAVSILQSFGYMGGPHITVSRTELAQMVNDTFVMRQDEERQLIGMALVRLKEEGDLQRRQDLKDIYGYLVSLEERYLANLEENQRHLRTLLSR